MKKWVTLFPDTMKSDNKKLREYISNYIKKFLAEAEEEKPADDAKDEAPAEEEGGEENPFAAGGEEGDSEEGGEKTKDDKESEKKPEQPAGIPLQFNISKVKQYNNSNFLSDKGIVKSIDKRGIVVTTQPDNVDVLVNFDDISESAKKFFKRKK